MIDAQAYKQYQRIAKVIQQVQQQHAGNAVIHSTYNTRYYDDKPSCPVQVINVYIYVGRHMTELQLTPAGDLQGRLPGMIDAVVTLLSSIGGGQ